MYKPTHMERRTDNGWLDILPHQWARLRGEDRMEKEGNEGGKGRWEGVGGVIKTACNIGPALYLLMLRGSRTSSWKWLNLQCVYDTHWECTFYRMNAAGNLTTMALLRRELASGLRSIDDGDENGYKLGRCRRGRVGRRRCCLTDVFSSLVVSLTTIVSPTGIRSLASSSRLPLMATILSE